MKKKAFEITYVAPGASEGRPDDVRTTRRRAFSPEAAIGALRQEARDGGRAILVLSIAGPLPAPDARTGGHAA